MSALLALCSALSFGVADFLGGLATRRARALVVTLLAQVSGGVLAVLVVPVLGGQPSRAAFVIGGVAGVAGVLGLVAYLHALATGPMGVTAPIAAVAGAVVPIAVGVAGGERPGTAAVWGMVLGVVAAVLVSVPSRAGLHTEERAVARRAALWALAAGAGFGCFFVGLDATPAGSGLWPLLGARAVSVPLMGGLVAATTRGRDGAGVPWRLGAASGVLDMAANALFLLATRSGLLSVTSVLASLYPAVVAVLAAVLLRERLAALQYGGVVTAIAAVALLAL